MSDTNFFATSASRIVQCNYSPANATAGAVDAINVTATYVATDNQTDSNVVYALANNGDVYQFRRYPPPPKIHTFSASPNDGYGTDRWGD